MPVNLRRGHDGEVGKRAAVLFASGHGSKFVARELGVPGRAVRKRLLTYGAVGRGLCWG